MPEKIIVAVHGIGEPVRCATIQAVAFQFCKYYEVPADIPLGRLSAELVLPPGTLRLPGAYMVKTPPDPRLSPGLGFGEVYWKDVVRGPAKDLYTLEEAKKWSKTVVERVRALDLEVDGPLNLNPKDYLLAAQVIEEMIQTSRVLGCLLYFAEKAGFFQFDLDQVLIDYLGDVQIVADFSSFRKEIVGRFQGVLAQIHRDHPDADIHIVAHSEGTVIAFLGLLEALHLPEQAARPDSQARPGWVKRIRGFMTIGSPINKHLFLWPELWRDLASPPKPPLESPIQWRNYYDYGDPVGFRLDTARTWLDLNGWQGYFEFDPQEHDIGFTRYYFAGKAHNDYWIDDGVFGHFIQTVVQPEVAQGQPSARPYAPPRTLLIPKLVSPALPYLLAIGLVLAGVYLLYKAVGVCLQSSINESVCDMVRNVLGISYLLIGVTAAVRIPRLTRHIGWRLAGLAIFVSSLWVFPFFVTDDFLNHRLGRIFLVLDQNPSANNALDYVHSITRHIGIRDMSLPALGLLCIAGFVFLIAWTLGRLRPSWGVNPLLFLGGPIIFAIVALRLSDIHQDEIRLREALAKTGLSGNFLAEATNKIMTKLAEHPGGLKDFDLQAEKEANQVIREEKFAALVKPSENEGPAPDRRVPVVKIPPEMKATKLGPIWPVLVAGTTFLYLWWLAALLFDLVVVWQHYIRSSAILNRLHDIHPLTATAVKGISPIAHPDP